jgi:hypothetical protein
MVSSLLAEIAPHAEAILRGRRDEENARSFVTFLKGALKDSTRQIFGLVIETNDEIVRRSVRATGDPLLVAYISALRACVACEEAISLSEAQRTRLLLRLTEAVARESSYLQTRLRSDVAKRAGAAKLDAEKHRRLIDRAKRLLASGTRAPRELPAILARGGDAYSKDHIRRVLQAAGVMVRRERRMVTPRSRLSPSDRPLLRSASSSR